MMTSFIFNDGTRIIRHLGFAILNIKSISFLKEKMHIFETWLSILGFLGNVNVATQVTMTFISQNAIVFNCNKYFKCPVFPCAA